MKSTLLQAAPTTMLSMPIQRLLPEGATPVRTVKTSVAKVDYYDLNGDGREDAVFTKRGPDRSLTVADALDDFEGRRVTMTAGENGAVRSIRRTTHKDEFVVSRPGPDANYLRVSRRTFDAC